MEQDCRIAARRARDPRALYRSRRQNRVIPSHYV